MIPEHIQDIKTRYGIVGRDEKLILALDTAIQVAKTDLSVLIQGESGVGKEIIPRVIHDCSLRKNKRYIAINCGSIPEGTIDSELFGHEKGSYTGAIGERDGYFGAADGGTLFLDEVGELPMTTQARLLRVLETGEYIRVGSDTPRRTNVRIVAATNVDIPQAIKEGRFREDLYYRLCSINILMPPLRDRGYDAVLLFKLFAMNTASKYHILEPVRLSEDGEQTVMAYKWPGNVRQLKNVVEQISILEQGAQINSEVLARYGIIAGQGEKYAIQPTNRQGKDESGRDWANEISWLASAVMKLRAEVDELKSIILSDHKSSSAPLQLQDLSTLEQAIEPEEYIPATPIVPPAPKVNIQPSSSPEVIVPPIPSSHEYDEIEILKEESNLNIVDQEKQNIIRALHQCKNSKRMAAKMLGISERTLYRRIKDYDIE